MRELKNFIHNFIGKRLGEFNCYSRSISKKEPFDQILLSSDEGMRELASFLDEAISAHAIIAHTDLSKYESPEIKQMPFLIERQNQYFIYLKIFFDDAQTDRNVDVLSEKFCQALINSINKNNEHLLKRVKNSWLLLWRQNDTFSEMTPMMDELKKILKAAPHPLPRMVK